MTAREYARECGVDLVGKLVKETHIRKEWDYIKCEMVDKKVTFYKDEIGNEISGSKKDGWCLVTADGDAF